MPNIAVIFNGENAKSRAKAAEVAAYIGERQAGLFAPPGGFGYTIDDLREGVDFGGCDAAVVLGGDGTLLAAVRHLSEYGVPLFGVNMGRVGFLSSVENEQAFDAIDWYLAGNYFIQERLMLSCKLYRGGREIESCTAFNDLVVNSGVFSRAVTLDLFIDKQKINSYNADGIIVSTPTGSTGYSLSAGGPIVMEDLSIMLITPVCPHTFFSRPIVASAAGEVEIVCKSAAGVASLTSDGQYRFSVEKEDEIAISAADTKALIIRFSQHHYFERIKEKLYKID
ncbi:MAG: NAD(+)/NADH kinase [Bacillota bacterium]|nr:NAD(+)/NADH kinase [Bacillota bacterium]